MMKRLFIALALLLPLAAFGETVERDVLLTGDGTLYTVESQFTRADQSQIQSTSYLTLTSQVGTESKTEFVPVTLTGGSHGEPALAYDSETKTLFLFWAQGHGRSSDLLFTTYQDGKWGKVTSLDSIDWDLRHNLRIALTRKTEDTSAGDGRKVVIPEINVHATWWEEGRESEWARYAMITLDHGDVSSISVMNLNNLLGHVDPVAEKPSKNELLRHPAVFESNGHDTVDIVFGDIKTDKLHRITVKPGIMAGKIHIPIGKDHEVPTPTAISMSIDNVGAVSSGSDNLAYYFSSDNAVKYVVFKDGVWSSLRSMPVSDKLSTDGAVNALRRMLNSE